MDIDDRKLKELEEIRKKNEEISIRLKERLEELNKSQKELADETYITDSSISYYLSGKKTPSIYNLLKMAKNLGVTLGYLVNEEGKPISKDGEEDPIATIPVLKNIKSTETLFNNPKNVEKYLPIIKECYRDYKNMFAAKVKSTNMFPRIYPSDILIAERFKFNDKLVDGDICILTIGDNEAICREVTQTTDGYVFNPYDTNLPPKFYSWDDIQTLPIVILGKVIELRKNFE